MTPKPNTASNSFPEISGYTLVEQLYDGSRTAVYRALEHTQQRSVAIKVLQNEYPTFSELVQFKNQYAIASHLKISGIVRPLSLEAWKNGYALVMVSSSVRPEPIQSKIPKTRWSPRTTQTQLGVSTGGDGRNPLSH